MMKKLRKEGMKRCNAGKANYEVHVVLWQGMGLINGIA